MNSFPMLIRMTDTGEEILCARSSDIPRLREFTIVKTWKDAAR